MTSPVAPEAESPLSSAEFAPLAPDLLASFEGQRQRAAVMSQLFGEPEVRPTIGRFTLLRKLGAGGMGVVYAAYDPRLDRTIALKLLRGRDGERARLLGEARLLAKLSHPNVVAVFDVGELDGQVYIAMEYVAGETLRAWMQGGPRPWRATVALLLQAGRGLAAAHAAGIVHRDFKPENTIIEANGRVRVLDFGLAAPAGGDDLSVAGTPGYIAPEQRAGRSDVRSDQFSFCVTLYEALHGALPGADGPRRRDLPGRLERALERGLQRDPSARWPSLERLLAELEAAPRRRRRAWQAAGLAGLLALSFGAAWTIQRGELAACSGIADLADDVWDASRRATVEQAMRATGMPAAAQAFAAVDQRLRDHSDAWATTYRAACSAHRRDELSEETYSDAVGCLLEHRARARALVESLAAGGEELVLQAARSAAELGRPDACLGAAARGSGATSPAPELAALRSELAAAAAESRLARHDNARRHAHAAIAAAQRHADPGLVARAVFTLGAVEHGARRHAVAERLLTEAYFRGLAADNVEVTSKAALHLVALVGYQQRDFVRAAYWEETLAALASRRDDPTLRAHAQQNIGMLRAAQDRFAEARAGYDRALAWHEGNPDSRPDDIARLLDLRSHALHVLDDDDAAIADARRALELRERFFGPEHPVLAKTLNNLGALYKARKQYTEARAALERAIALDPEGALAPLTNLADIFNELRDHDAEIATSRRALAIAEAMPGAGYQVTGARDRLGRALTRVGRFDEGLPLLRRSLQEYRDRFGVRHREFGHAAQELARALSLRLTVEDLDEALALLRVASAAYAPGGADARRLAGDLQAMTDARAELVAQRDARRRRAGRTRPARE